MTGCNNIDTLNLSRNKIGEVTESIGLLSNLTYLDLSHNLIDKLPEEIGDILKFKRLIVCGNQLDAMPESLEPFFEMQKSYRDFEHNPYDRFLLFPNFYSFRKRAARNQFSRRKLIIAHWVHEGGYPLGYSSAFTLGVGINRKGTWQNEKRDLMNLSFLSGKGIHLLLEPGVNGGRIGAGVNYMPSKSRSYGFNLGFPQYTLRAIGTKFWEGRDYRGHGGERYVGVELGYSRFISIRGGVSWEYGDGEKMLYSISLGWTSFTTGVLLPNI